MKKLVLKNKITKYALIIFLLQFFYPLLLSLSRYSNIYYFSNLDAKLRTALKEKIAFILNSRKNYDSNLKDINVQEFITINNRKDLLLKKDYLKNFLDIKYKNNKLKYFKNDNSLKFKNKNIKVKDKLVYEMDNKINSIAYLITPFKRNNNLLIFHLGHDGNFNTYRRQINFFINNGYDLLLVAMPLTGENNRPIINVVNIGKIKLNNHNKMKFLELKDETSPISYFLLPVNAFLNKLVVLKNYKQINMVGISGGGWTTIVFSAFNNLIDLSFSVAGGRPISLMFDNQFGDYEQTQPSFYSIFNNFDLYLMASHNNKDRKFFQVINKYEECCFKYWEVYEKSIKNISRSMGGSFNIFIDKTHASHNISTETLRFIHYQINKNQNY